VTTTRTGGFRAALAAMLWISAAASAAAAAAAAPSPLVAATERFAFWSDLEVNLHYFLYQWASGAGEAPRGRWPVAVAEREELSALEAGERAAWQRAVDHYREHLIARNLLFDEEMKAIRNHLAGTAPEAASELVRATAAALADALPIYERRWWPAHDAANRRWVEALVPLLVRVEGGLAPRLAKAFGGSWPEAAVRVDVAAYANDLGAYSTEAAAGPAPHVVVSSGDDSYAGTAAVEMVFHEAGHSDTLIGAASGPLDAAVEAAGATGAPRDLWHALLFYTAGELAREALAAAGVPDYRPYAEANGLWPRGRGWAAARAAFDAHWRPYLAAGGGPGRDEALAAVARALAEHPAG
jgi:hypothetical protein